MRFRSLLSQDANIWQEFLTPGVFILENNQRKSILLTTVVTLYFACFFVLYVAHEASQQPVSTMWIDRSLIGNYSFSVDTGNTPIPDDVTSSVSKSMRDNLFTWPRSIDFTPPIVTGIIQTRGPADATSITCNAPTSNASSKFQCFGKLWPQADDPSAFIPLSSDFYYLDVQISPAPGTSCSDLEVYRVSMDADQNIAHPLDFPASSTASQPAVGHVQSPICGIFQDSSWCLSINHPFTLEQYKAKVAEKCKAQGQSLVIRLPARSTDVESASGRIGLDVLLVTTGATVNMHASWKPDPPESYSIMQPTWNQIVTTDSIQPWRVSTNPSDIFLRFFLAVSPLLFGWYYVTLGFESSVSKNGIIILTVLVFFPSVLVFLTIGAWIPMIGCLVCIIAVNQASTNKHSKITAGAIEFMRHSLLFVLAATNSIQFAWLIALVVQAGWTAFLHDTTINQLYDLSHNFIVKGSAPPNWIALVLPCAMAINISYLLGTAICIALEVTALKFRASIPQ